MTCACTTTPDGDLSYCADHRACFRALDWIERGVVLAVAVGALVLVTLAGCAVDWHRVSRYPLDDRPGVRRYVVDIEFGAAVWTPDDVGPRPARP